MNLCKLYPEKTCVYHKKKDPEPIGIVAGYRSVRQKTQELSSCCAGRFSGDGSHGHFGRAPPTKDAIRSGKQKAAYQQCQSPGFLGRAGSFASKFRALLLKTLNSDTWTQNRRSGKKHLPAGQKDHKRRTYSTVYMNECILYIICVYIYIYINVYMYIP